MMLQHRSVFHHAFLSTLAAVVALASSSALGGGMITNFTQAELESALAGGGAVLFGTDGTVMLSNTVKVTRDSVLDAQGHHVKISGGGAVRLFQVNTNVKFAVSGLTLADGKFAGANGANADPAPPGQDGYGGGILNSGGNVTLVGCVITNCVAQGGNGGTDSTTPANTTGQGGRGMGGALCNLGGQLSLTNCLFSGNLAAGGQGSTALYVLLPSGDSGNGSGGGIYSEGGSLYLHNVTLSTNQAVGGPAWAQGGNRLAGDGQGGAIFATNGSVLIEDCQFNGNSVVGPSAPNSVVFPGAQAGSGLGGALFVSSGSSATVVSSTFQGDSAAGGSGGKYNPSGASAGGGIFNAGLLNVQATTFTAEACSNGYTSASTAAGQGLARGGAICSLNSLVLNGCTFNGSHARGGDGVLIGGLPPVPGSPGEGGALWISGLLSGTNCTLTANGATGGGDPSSIGIPGGPGHGGGLCVSGGSVELVNFTIAGNAAESGLVVVPSLAGAAQGGSLWCTNSMVRLRNTMLAKSTSGGEVWGGITDGGYNLCSDGTAALLATGSLNNADPLLAALSNNGGPTPTMSLLAGSPARDAVPAGFPAVDQRGTPRPQGPAADIGAFEADYLAGPPTIANQPQSASVRAGANVTLSVVASGTGALAYQWFKDGQSLAGETLSMLTLTNVQDADTGSYWVVVANTSGSTPSQDATLEVDSSPLILTPPASAVVLPGATTNFSVIADGPGLSYQWWHEGTPISGATTPVYTISSALADAKGSYRVVVSNFAASATSAVATLTFDASALTILVPPKAATVEAGYPASFSVLVSGVPPFSYQWQHNGQVIAGATGSSCQIPAVSAADAGSYTVIVDNGYRQLTSSSAQLTVTPGAVQPQILAGRVGSTLTLTFQAEARVYRLLSSTNLTLWTPVATNSVVAPGLVQFVQPFTPAPQSFYRVVTP